jgi:chromosome segregation ATPase
MSAMSDQPLTLAVLAQFHRDVILPDVERVVGALESRMNARFDDVYGHFDAVYRRFDRLETEYQMLLAGLRQVEDRLGAVEQRVAGLEERINRLEERVGRLEEGMRRVEERLEDFGHRLAAVESGQQRLALPWAIAISRGRSPERFGDRGPQ